MMTYQNTRTGVKITVPCQIFGKDWVLMDDKPVEKPSTGKPRQSRKKEQK